MASRKRSNNGPASGGRNARQRTEEDYDQSPVVWFMRLCVFQEKRDQAGIDKCLTNLERLGYFVVPYPPRPDMGQAATLKGGGA